MSPKRRRRGSGLVRAAPSPRSKPPASALGDVRCVPPPRRKRGLRHWELLRRRRGRPAFRPLIVRRGCGGGRGHFAPLTLRRPGCLRLNVFAGRRFVFAPSACVREKPIQRLLSALSSFPFFLPEPGQLPLGQASQRALQLELGLEAGVGDLEMPPLLVGCSTQLSFCTEGVEYLADRTKDLDCIWIGAEAGDRLIATRAGGEVAARALVLVNLRGLVVVSLNGFVVLLIEMGPRLRTRRGRPRFLRRIRCGSPGLPVRIRARCGHGYPLRTG